MRKTARITSAGPMNTYGRTRLAEPRRQQVDEAVHAPEQCEHTADADDDRNERRRASGWRPRHEGSRTFPRTAGWPRRTRQSTRRPSTESAGRRRAARARGRVDLGRFRRLVRHLRHAMTSPRERNARWGAAARRPLPSRAAVGRPTRGQLASMSSSTPSSESGPLWTYSSMPVQKLPPPTAAGIRSDASNRPVPAASASVKITGRVGQDVVGVTVRPDLDVRRDPRRLDHRRPSHTGRSPR